MVYRLGGAQARAEHWGIFVICFRQAMDGKEAVRSLEEIEEVRFMDTGSGGSKLVPSYSTT